MSSKKEAASGERAGWGGGGCGELKETPFFRLEREALT